MKNYIEISDLSVDSICQFVDDVLDADPEQGFNSLFMLGKAASYVETAVCLGIIDLVDGADLLDQILGFALEVEFP